MRPVPLNTMYVCELYKDVCYFIPSQTIFWGYICFILSVRPSVYPNYFLSSLQHWYETLWSAIYNHMETCICDQEFMLIPPKYFNLAAIFAPVPSQEFLAFVCLVSFSALVYFYVTWVYRSNSFAVPVYNGVLGLVAACPVVWWFPRRSLKTSGWPWADIFIPVDFLSLWHIHHTYSRYIYTRM